MFEPAVSIARFQPCSIADARHLEGLIDRDSEVSSAIHQFLGADSSKGTLGGGAPTMKQAVISSAGTNTFTNSTERNLQEVFSRILVRKAISAGDFSDLRRILGLSSL